MVHTSHTKPHTYDKKKVIWRIEELSNLLLLGFQSGALIIVLEEEYVPG